MKTFSCLFLLLLCCIFIHADNVIYVEKRYPQAGSVVPTSSAAPPPPASSSAAPPASGSGQPSGSVIPTQSAGGNVTAPGNGTANGNNTGNPLGGLPTSASYGVTVQPGMASFLQPTPSKSVSPLYRVDANENITFVWSYTNLLVRPANLTLAAVGPQSATYTIAGLQGDATSYVWQLNSVVPKTPLMNGYYQIQLYDQRGPSAYASPGWLMPQSRLTIAFYTPESYQPISNSNYCPTCFYSAAWKRSFGPIGTAFGIACVTSALLIYGLLN